MKIGLCNTVNNNVRFEEEEEKKLWKCVMSHLMILSLIPEMQKRYLNSTNANLAPSKILEISF